MKDKVADKQVIGNVLSQNIIQMQDEHIELREWFFEKYTQYTTEQNYFPIEAEINMDMFKQIDSLKSLILNLQKGHNPMKAEDKVFRKCPNPCCQLIWHKVEGCDGQTTCGARPSSKDVEGWKGKLGWHVRWYDSIWNSSSSNNYGYDIDEGEYDRKTTDNSSMNSSRGLSG